MRTSLERLVILSAARLGPRRRDIVCGVRGAKNLLLAILTPQLVSQRPAVQKITPIHRTIEVEFRTEEAVFEINANTTM